MEEKQINKLKELAKPLQEWLASNPNVFFITLKPNNIIAEYKELIEINTHHHFHNLTIDNAEGHTFSLK